MGGMVSDDPLRIFCFFLISHRGGLLFPIGAVSLSDSLVCGEALLMLDVFDSNLTDQCCH